jgi:hypothetical protein
MLNVWWSEDRLKLLERIAFRNVDGNFFAILKSGKKLHATAYSDGTYHAVLLLAAVVRRYRIGSSRFLPPVAAIDSVSSRNNISERLTATLSLVKFCTEAHILFRIMYRHCSFQ